MSMDGSKSETIIVELSELTDHTAGFDPYRTGKLSGPDLIRTAGTLAGRLGGQPISELACAAAFQNHQAALKFIEELLLCLRESDPSIDLLPNPTPLDWEIERRLGLLIRLQLHRGLVWDAHQTVSGRFRKVTDQIAQLRERSDKIRKSNLPSHLPSFYGRRRELAALRKLLVEESSAVVTLFGTGGTGKTRLALELAPDCVPAFPNGVWFADASEATNLDGVCQAVANALGVSLSGHDPVRQIGWVLSELGGKSLVILDNAEQVVRQTSESIAQWREIAPQTSWLVTSRERLGVGEEVVYQIDPLPVPRDLKLNRRVTRRLSDNECIRLFIDRAQRAMPSFLASDEDLPAICKICRKLGGIPLAIELAASRIRSLPPERLLDRLGKQGNLALVSQGTTRTARQATLSGAIDWSWQLMSQNEQAAMKLLCWFPSGLTTELAVSLLGSAGKELIESLLGKSMLRGVINKDGAPTRLSMFDSIRQFVQARCREGVASDQVPEQPIRGLQELLGYCDQVVSGIGGPSTSGLLDQLGLEVENLQSQQDLVRESDPELAARAALMAERYFLRRSSGGHRIGRLQTALEALRKRRSDDGRGAEASPTLVALLVALSRAYHATGTPIALELATSEAVQAARELVAVAPNADSRRLLADALSVRELYHRRLGEHEVCHHLLTEAILHATSAGDRKAAGALAGLRGEVYRRQGEYASALSCFSVAEQAGRQYNDQVTLAIAVGNRGVVHWSRGELQASIECLTEAAELAASVGDSRVLRVNIGNRGLVHVSRGDWEAAIECFETAIRLDREAGNLAGLARNIGNLGLVYLGRGELPHAMLQFVEAENMCKRLDALSDATNWLGCRGVVHYCQKEYETALAILKEASKSDRRLGNRHQLMHWLNAQAAIRLSQYLESPTHGVLLLGKALAWAGEARKLQAGLRLTRNVEYFRSLVMIARICWELADSDEGWNWVVSGVLVGNLEGNPQKDQLRSYAKQLASSATVLVADLNQILTVPISAGHSDIQVREAFRFLAPIG